MLRATMLPSIRHGQQTGAGATQATLHTSRRSTTTSERPESDAATTGQPLVPPGGPFIVIAHLPAAFLCLWVPVDCAWVHVECARRRELQQAPQAGWQSKLQLKTDRVFQAGVPLNLTNEQPPVLLLPQRCSSPLQQTPYVT